MFVPDFDSNVYGYKAFNKNWTCLTRQYTCPGEFRSQHIPVLCQTGMHFCIRLEDVFFYYGYDLRRIHVAEVKAFGSVAFGENKCATDGLQIIKELNIGDILSKVDMHTAKIIARCSEIQLIYNDDGHIVGYERNIECAGTTKIVML